MHNRRATTHWKSADAFRRLYPDVDLDPGVLYTHEGAVLTAAGVASGIDLCLYMIRCDHGASVANDVARGTVVPPHRSGGQAQFITEPVPETGTTSTSAARAWALSRLDQPVSLRELAAQESMSVRTFTRKFRMETGMSPTRGSSSSASIVPGNCWRTPTCRSTRARTHQVSAPPPPCGSIWDAHSGCPRLHTGPPSADRTRPLCAH